MRVPLRWLAEFVDITLPVEELCERLTMAGLEVASVEEVGAHWEGIFVGRIVEVRPHPNADRLTIAVVDYGREQALPVVTGAPNIRVGQTGQKVALALVGAQLYDGYSKEPKLFTLRPARIRGVLSEGMACSEKELGLGEDHSGILILDDDAPVGVPLWEYLGDTIIELDPTPNLGRALSVIGVAREVAALTGGALHIPEPKMKATGPSIEGQVKVEIADPDLCSRYTATLIRGVRVGPSPGWLQRRLRACGQRPINNIVDITNFVMLERGQPLHAFDYDKLTNGHIIVRRARPGERMISLDGVERIFSEEMLLITDPGGPIAVAGVMGGLDTEVTEGTVNVLLESANFHAINNRRTSQALKLPSEASLRFSRGLDPEGTAPAAIRATQLMRDLAGGTIAQGIADVYAVRPKPRRIFLAGGEVERILGMKLTEERVEEILCSLDFRCHRVQGGLEVDVPSYRLDVSIPADLIEEVARVEGYEKIPATLMADTLPPQRGNRALEVDEGVRDILAGAGLTEVITYSLTSLEAIAKLYPGEERPDEEYIKVANPLSSEHEYMRRSLVQSLLETVAANLRFTERVAIFELGRVYLPRGAEELPDEPRRVAMALVGPRALPSWAEQEPGDFDFFDLKGLVEELLGRLRIERWEFQPGRHPTFHPGQMAKLVVKGRELGVLGEIHPLVARAFDLGERRVQVAELDLEALIGHVEERRYYQALSRFPAIVQDLALVVDEKEPAQKVEKVVLRAGGELLVGATLFDLYRGEPIAAGKKSLAYSLTFQAPDRTLTDEEVNRIRERILRHLEREVGATLRT